MRAKLDYDIITGWTADETGVEVGRVPPGVGLERLRFDGERVVDLSTLTTIHVTRESGVFRLHAVPVPGSQPVSMTYADRKHLVDDSGVFRALTNVERVNSSAAASRAQLKAQLRVDLASEMGDTPDLLADMAKCLSLVLAYLAGGPDATEAKTIIDAIAPRYAGIYPLDSTRASLERNASVLKSKMKQYYQNTSL